MMMYRVNWNKIRKKYDIEEAPKNFKRKLKELNRIIKKYYLPGKRRKKILPKNDVIFDYNDSVLELGESSIILKYTEEFKNRMQKFKSMNSEIKDLPNNKLYDQVCYGLLCGEILNRFGNKLNQENYDTVVLWMRDAALIPTETEKTLLVGESSGTKNNMYEDLKKHIIPKIKKNEKILEKYIIDYLKDKEISKELKDFNDFISEKIEGKTAFVDTGFSGLQQVRTKIHIDKKNIDIVLGSKLEPIKYARDLELNKNEIFILENMDKPITPFREFNVVKDIVTEDLEYYNFVELDILDSAILQHLGFEMYQKEKIRDKKIERLFE